MPTILFICDFFFSSRRRHTRSKRDWSSDVCSSDLNNWHRIKIDYSMPVIIDPIMADFGKLYDGFSEDFPEKFRKLVKYADIIVRSEERRVGKECRSGWEREE